MYLAREKSISLVLTRWRCDSPWTKHWPIISQLSVQHSWFYYWEQRSPADNLEAIEGIMLHGNDHLPVMHGQGGWSYKYVKTELHSVCLCTLKQRCWSSTTVLCCFLGDLRGGWDVVGEQKRQSAQLYTKPSDVQ